MRLNSRAASTIVSALPSFRVLCLFGGVLLLSESVVLATTLFAGALASFAAGLVIAATIYRAESRRARATEDPANVSKEVRREKPKLHGVKRVPTANAQSRAAA